MPGSPSHGKKHALSSANDHKGQLLKAQQQATTCYEDEANVWSAAQNLLIGSEINGESIASEAFVEAAIQVTYLIQSKSVNDPSTLTPSLDQKWIVGSTPVGVWAGHADDIANWNGSSWDFDTPTEGWKTWVLDEDVTYIFDGTNWVKIGSTVTHANLIGLTAPHDDHTQYLLVDGTRAMAANLQMGTNKITGVVDPTANQDVATKKYVDDQDVLHNEFVELTDTPANYTSQGYKLVSVNGTPNALVFTDRALSGAGNPDGVVTGLFGQTYKNTTSGIWYVCKSNPTGTAWEVV